MTHLSVRKSKILVFYGLYFISALTQNTFFNKQIYKHICFFLIPKCISPWLAFDTSGIKSLCFLFPVSILDFMFNCLITFITINQNLSKRVAFILFTFIIQVNSTYSLWAAAKFVLADNLFPKISNRTRSADTSVNVPSSIVTTILAKRSVAPACGACVHVSILSIGIYEVSWQQFG